jgi:hypothetical protein
LQRLTLGGICSYKAARALMENKLGSSNPISTNIENIPSPDGRSRYPVSLRAGIYTHIVKIARDLRRNLEIALCLEEKNLWKISGLENDIGRCNCVL